MITAPWGTPEYSRQQQEMWNRKAADERQRQETANQQIRRQQAEQKAREVAQRKHLDTMAGMIGHATPMYGNYDSFRMGRNMVGRDHNGKLPSYSSPAQQASSGTSTDGAAGAILLIVGILSVLLWLATQ